MFSFIWVVILQVELWLLIRAWQTYRHWMNMSALKEYICIEQNMMYYALINRARGPYVEIFVLTFKAYGPNAFRFMRLKKVPYLLFWRETYPQTFPPEFLSICEYNSWRKTACYRPLKNWHKNWYKCLYGENDGAPILGKTVRETNVQTIIRWELMLNTLQIDQRNYTFSTVPSSNRRNFEDSGKVLAVSVSEFYWSIAVQLYQPMLIWWLSLLHVCVQIDNCFCITWIVVHQRAALMWFRGTLLSAI